MQEKIQNKAFVFEIIESELAALICVINKKILLTNSQCFRNSPKVLDITKRDFFQVPCFHSDQ